MLVINIDAESTAGTVEQIRDVIGGSIEERWGEHIFTVDNEIAKGNIRSITFDWGVNLLEYDITFSEEVELIMNTSLYNPIHFTYCLQGTCSHRFGYQKEKEIRTLEQFQSVIISSKEGGYNHCYFPKNENLAINVIQIVRGKFVKKRLNNVSQLNKKLYEVFMDTDHDNRYAYFGAFNLKLAETTGALRKIKQSGMIRILQIEGLVYQILSMHIQQHERVINNRILPTTLLKTELRTIRQIAKKITGNVSKEYSLEQLSIKSGLSQAKLQEGFKLMYARTVTEYIRHVRLEAARDLLNHTDLNISQIVYSIGFSSRSYFSKIFKDKYNISPSDHQKQLKASLKKHSEIIDASIKQNHPML